MVKGKIIEYLNSISKEEFDNLEYFLSSPSFVKSVTAKKFYLFTKKVKKEKKVFLFTWREISDSVYKDEKFNENKVMKLTSDFCKIIEKYFEFLIFVEDIRYKKNALLISLNRRGLVKYFDKEFTDTNFKDINLTADDFYYSYGNEIELLLRKKKIDLLGLEDRFFNIILFVKLEHLINAQTNNYKGKIFLSKEILSYLQKNEINLKKNFPSVYSRFVVYKILIGKNAIKHFYELKGFLEQNDRKLELKTLDYLYDKLLFYCRLNQKSKAFKKEEFSINKKLEKRGVYREKKIGYMSFLNAVESALVQNEQHWTVKFIENYGENINEFKQETLATANALLEIHKKNYNEALKYANVIRNRNPYFYVMNKSLIKRILSNTI